MAVPHPAVANALLGLAEPFRRRVAIAGHDEGIVLTGFVKDLDAVLGILRARGHVLQITWIEESDEADDPEKVLVSITEAPPAKHKRTAADAHLERENQIDALIERLQTGLTDHRLRFLADGSRSWDFVGDLAHVEGLLAQCVAAVGAMDEEEGERRGL